MIDNGTSEVDLKKILTQTLHWFFRHSKSLFLYFLLVLLLSIAFFIFQKQKFYLSYTISSDYMSGEKIEIIYGDVNKLLGQNQTTRLAALLHLPEKDIKKILGFKITVDEPFQNLQLNNSKPDFHFNETNTSIKITLSDSSNAFQLVNALNNFVSSSNYFQKIKKNELLSIEKINENLQMEKRELDSIHEINLRKFSQSNGNLIMLNDLSQIKQNTYLIQERLISNFRGVDRLEDPINVISHPIVQPQSLFMIVLVSFAKGFAVITSIFIVFIVYRKAKKSYRLFKNQS
jgi:hypothetical protein